MHKNSGRGRTSGTFYSREESRRGLTWFEIKIAIDMYKPFVIGPRWNVCLFKSLEATSEVNSMVHVTYLFVYIFLIC